MLPPFVPPPAMWTLVAPATAFFICTRICCGVIAETPLSDGPFLPPQPARSTATIASQHAKAERIWLHSCRSAPDSQASSVASSAVDSKRIHHVGVAVADLDEAIDTYSRLFGAELELRETVSEQGVETALMRVGDGRIELLASLEPDTPVGRFIDRRGPGMHHLAFEVDDVASELERLAAGGAELIDEHPRTGLMGREIAFIHPHATGGVLAELVACG